MRREITQFRAVFLLVSPITTGLNNAVIFDLLKPRVKCMRAPFVSVLPEKVAQDVEANH